MEEKNSRRDFLKKTATLAIGGIAASAINTSFAATNKNLITAPAPEEEKFKLAPLPYSYDALEPHIDKLTMEIHYSKHHQGYVNNLNKAIESVNKELISGNYSLENIFKHIDKLPVAVRNNAGGHYNHTLFWELMKANGGGQPKGKLSDSINSTFGSFDNFQKKFSEAASSRFGSGWAWLVSNNGKLYVSSTPNQDNPLMNLNEIEVKGTPILALDVWEHAYYLKNQNRRADYITSWWSVVNWNAVEENFQRSL